MPDGDPTVEHAVFGTVDAARLASWYERFCEQVLGSPIAGALFYAASVGGGEALWLLAYTARCEHAIEARYPDLRPRRARGTLEEQRTAFLAALRPS
jgi:hypothetical protein